MHGGKSRYDPGFDPQGELVGILLGNRQMEEQIGEVIVLKIPKGHHKAPTLADLVKKLGGKCKAKPRKAVGRDRDGDELKVLVVKAVELVHLIGLGKQHIPPSNGVGNSLGAVIAATLDHKLKLIVIVGVGLDIGLIIKVEVKLLLRI